MDARSLARKWARRSQMVDREFRKTSNGLAIAAIRYTREKLTQEIYAFPVPTNPKTGKKLWKRTGNLRRGERAEVPDPYTVRVINDVSYAVPRHEAGKTGHRPVRYPSHWRDDLARDFRSVLTDAYRLTMDAIRRAR